MSYQDFDGKGDSKSHDKLKALRLDDFARVTDRDRDNPLKGLSVLDIGCNEGFFCVEAVRQGARHVVGVDKSATFIERARQHCPEGHFLHASWWDVPNEEKDVILFLSAIHYEPDQKALLAFLRSRLKPSGTLILECGVARGMPGRRWHTINRADGPRRYPTEELLLRDLLAGYAVRWVGPSINQAGDAMPRYVYHCTPKSSIALLIAAPGGSGKTTLAHGLTKHGLPSYDIDSLFHRLMRDANYAWSPLQAILREHFKEPLIDCGAMALFLVDRGLHESLCEAVASECPAETEMFCIEGEALRHDKIMNALVIGLRCKNVTTWGITPALPALGKSTTEVYRPPL